MVVAFVVAAHANAAAVLAAYGMVTLLARGDAWGAALVALGMGVAAGVFLCIEKMAADEWAWCVGRCVVTMGAWLLLAHARPGAAVGGVLLLLMGIGIGTYIGATDRDTGHHR